MRQFFKDELLFLFLALFQWVSAIYVPFWILRNVSFLNVQLFFLIIFALFLFIIFRFAHKKYQAIGNQYYLYTLIILVGCISLGSFSMEEFKMLGFDFSTSPERAINEYFWVKTLFNFIGLSCLPSLLTRYLEMKKKSQG